ARAASPSPRLPPSPTPRARARFQAPRHSESCDTSWVLLGWLPLKTVPGARNASATPAQHLEAARPEPVGDFVAKSRRASLNLLEVTRVLDVAERHVPTAREERLLAFAVRRRKDRVLPTEHE